MVGLNDATQIVAGSVHTCARRQNGGIVCWGTGGQGQLGDGSGENRSTPVAVPANGSAQAVAVRSHLGHHTCAEYSNRTVRCWGSNQDGQIGNGTRIARPTPTDVRLR